MERARLKNIHLRYQLRKLEQTLKQKEELSEAGAYTRPLLSST